MTATSAIVFPLSDLVEELRAEVVGRFDPLSLSFFALTSRHNYETYFLKIQNFEFLATESARLGSMDLFRFVMHRFGVVGVFPESATLFKDANFVPSENGWLIIPPFLITILSEAIKLGNIRFLKEVFDAYLPSGHDALTAVLRDKLLYFSAVSAPNEKEVFDFLLDLGDYKIINPNDNSMEEYRRSGTFRGEICEQAMALGKVELVKRFLLLLMKNPTPLCQSLISKALSCKTVSSIEYLFSDEPSARQVRKFFAVDKEKIASSPCADTIRFLMKNCNLGDFDYMIYKGFLTDGSLEEKVKMAKEDGRHFSEAHLRWANETGNLAVVEFLHRELKIASPISDYLSPFGYGMDLDKMKRARALGMKFDWKEIESEPLNGIYSYDPDVLPYVLVASKAYDQTISIDNEVKKLHEQVGVSWQYAAIVSSLVSLKALRLEEWVPELLVYKGMRTVLHYLKQQEKSGRPNSISYGQVYPRLVEYWMSSRASCTQELYDFLAAHNLLPSLEHFLPLVAQACADAHHKATRLPLFLEKRFLANEFAVMEVIATKAPDYLFEYALDHDYAKGEALVERAMALRKELQLEIPQ